MNRRIRWGMALGVTAIVVLATAEAVLITPAAAGPPRQRPAVDKPVPGHSWTRSNVAGPPPEPAAITPTVAWPTTPRSTLKLQASGKTTTSVAGGPRIADGWHAVGSSGIAVAAEPTTAAAPASVSVQVLDKASSARYGKGLVLRLSRADNLKTTTPVAVRVPKSLLDGLYGASYAARVRWMQLPGGAAASSTAVPATTQGSMQVVSAKVGSQASLLVAAASPVASDGTGSFAATSLKSSEQWEVSAQTGSFTWSYPLRVPPAAAGPAPSLALSYDSGSVDGETGSTNNQPSGIGEGWSLGGGGFIERSYVPCAQDGHASSGDLCWKTDNATLSFGGHSSTMVKDATTGGWRLQPDDGTKIEKQTGASNGDDNGERWQLTTPDGTEYFFGRLTTSAWTVPVVGDDGNEPCNAGTFATSVCSQAWRWNLDYVRDTHGNVETFTYTPEVNYYRFNNTTPKSYTRGGYLAEIDYGIRPGSSTVPQRVVFEDDYRCPDGTTCDSAHPANWPDTPRDQLCASGAACTGLISPSFFTSNMISKIRTQLRASDGTYSDVDVWTLTHSFPDPGDGTKPALWFKQIAQTGKVGGATWLPPLITHGTTMQNRVWAVDGLAPLDRYRISSLTTETGALISVNYSEQECTPAMVPGLKADPRTNSHRCYPQKWSPDITPPQEPQTDFFHKYVVTTVLSNPATTTNSGGTDDIEETDYDYYTGTGLAWRYDNSPLVPDADRTWSVFAGFDKVRIRHGDHYYPAAQETTGYTFFQGMDGDHGSTGQVTLTASDGTQVVDHRWLAGRVLEKVVTNGVGGGQLSDTITTPWWSANATANDGTVAAYHIGDAEVATKTPLSNGSTRTTRVTTTFDSHGRPHTVQDATPDAGATCTTTDYADNATDWLMSYPSEVRAVGVACAATPSYPRDAISDTRTYYDGSSTLGAAPTTGEPSRTDVAKSYSGSTPQWLTTALIQYDDLGRPKSVTDQLNRVTTTRYTPELSGPLDHTYVTNPLGWQTITAYNPAWGVPTAVVDANQHRTDVSYDVFGRRTQVWLPDRPKANNPSSPSISYGYTALQTAALAVSTATLTPDGTGTVTSYALFDALGRPRQTQTPSETGGRLITDTEYDGAGRVALSNEAYSTTGAASKTLYVPESENGIPGDHQFTYDGASRPTVDEFRVLDSARWSTTYAYPGADRTDATPPDGAAPTSTFTDSRGRTTKLIQYHGSSPTGAGDATTYGYDLRGGTTSMSDAAGNDWSWTFDVLGRQVSASDPDTGTTTSSYDDAGRLTATKDARNQTLAYGYDDLDRKTGEYSGSLTGTRLASWAYDTLSKGQLTSSTRYVDGAAYTTAVTGYDAADRPLGTTVTVPSAAGALAGSYTHSVEYYPNGMTKIVRDPAVGGLPAEGLYYGRTPLGNVTDMDGLDPYANKVGYSALGQIVEFYRGSFDDVDLREIREYENGTNRLTLQSATLSPNTVNALGYAYDDAGDVTSVKAVGVGQSQDPQCFRYDYAQRLSQAWTPAGGDCTSAPSAALGGPAPYWHSYTYDAVGDRKTVTDHAPAESGGSDSTDTYTYPAAGAAQPHAVQSISHSGGGTDTYTYDEAGHTKTRPNLTSGQQSLTWNAEGHLSTINGSDPNVYTADGALLIAHSSDGSDTLYLGDTELHAPVSGPATATRTYTFAGAGPVAHRTGTAGVSGTTWGWLFSNAQGTAISAVNTLTGAITRRYYDPFGAPRGTPPLTWPDQHGYIDGPTNPDTGLTHLGAREYDPATGRFLSVDPLLDPADPQSLTGYAYANNDPVTKSDPTGMKWAEGPAGGGTCDQSCMQASQELAPPPAPGGGSSNDETPPTLSVPGCPTSDCVMTTVDDGGIMGSLNRLTGGTTNFLGGVVDESGGLIDCMYTSCDMIPFMPHGPGAMVSGWFNHATGVDTGSGAFQAGKWTTFVLSALLGGEAGAAAKGSKMARWLGRLGSKGKAAAEEGEQALSYSAKISKQMGPRGWTNDSISETVKNPVETHSVWDYTTGDKLPATAYVQRGGGYVVVNDSTSEIVQVSDLNKANWKPVWDDPRFQR